MGESNREDKIFRMVKRFTDAKETVEDEKCTCRNFSFVQNAQAAIRASFESISSIVFAKSCTELDLLFYCSQCDSCAELLGSLLGSTACYLPLTIQRTRQILHQPFPLKSTLKGIWSDCLREIVSLQ